MDWIAGRIAWLVFGLWIYAVSAAFPQLGISTQRWIMDILWDRKMIDQFIDNSYSLLEV